MCACVCVYVRVVCTLCLVVSAHFLCSIFLGWEKSNINNKRLVKFGKSDGCSTWNARCISQLRSRAVIFCVDVCVFVCGRTTSFFFFCCCCVFFCVVTAAAAAAVVVYVYLCVLIFLVHRHHSALPVRFSSFAGFIFTLRVKKFPTRNLLIRTTLSLHTTPRARGFWYRRRTRFPCHEIVCVFQIHSGWLDNLWWLANRKNRSKYTNLFR